MSVRVSKSVKLAGFDFLTFESASNRRKSISTEQAYVDRVRRFIHFHQLRHLSDMRAREVGLFWHISKARRRGDAESSQARTEGEVDALLSHKGRGGLLGAAPDAQRESRLR